MQSLVPTGRTWVGWSADDLLAGRGAGLRLGLRRVSELLAPYHALRGGDERAADTHGRGVAPNSTARRCCRRATAAYRAAISTAP